MSWNQNLEDHGFSTPHGASPDAELQFRDLSSLGLSAGSSRGDLINLEKKWDASLCPVPFLDLSYYSVAHTQQGFRWVLEKSHAT